MTASPRPSSARRAALLSVADQGISSLANFGIAFLAAISLSANAFGAFATVYLLYALIVAGAQAVISQELVLHEGSQLDRASRSREAAAFAALIGCGCSMLMIAFAAFDDGALRWPLVALSLTLPVLLVQDTLRHSAALMHRMTFALVSDAAWLALALVGISVIRASSIPDDAAMFLAAWAVAGCVATLVLLPLLTGAESLSLRRFCSVHYLGYRFFWEFMALRATSQVLILLLAALSGLTATGGVRGATTLFGPLTVALLAAASFGVPVIRAVPSGRRQTALALMVATLVGAALALTACLLLVSDNVGERILGDTWSSAKTFVPALGAQSSFTAVSTVVFLALRMITPRSTLRLRVLPALALPVAFFVGYAMDGAVGAVWGIAVGSGAQAVIAVGAYARFRARGVSLERLDAPVDRTLAELQSPRQTT